MMTSGLVNGDKKMARGKHLRGYLPGMKKPTKQVPTVIAPTINVTLMKKTGKTKQRSVSCGRLLALINKG